MTVWLETDDVDIKFTREEIEAETDLEKLRSLREAIRPVAEDLGDMAGAFKQGGVEQYDLCYKLGHLKMGLRWIERRMAALGVDDLGSPREIAQARQITTLLRQAEMLRSELATYRLLAGESAQ